MLWLGCQVVRLSGCQVVRLSGCQVVRLSGCQVVRLLFQSVRVSTTRSRAATVTETNFWSSSPV